MAAAVLRHRLPEPTRDAVGVESAGAFTVDGKPATPTAVEALEREGIDPGTHRSRRLTAAIARDADLILTMEPEHRTAVLGLVPELEDRVHLLHEFRAESEPAVDQVHDPYGGSAEIYAESLTRIRRHVDRVVRFVEEAVGDSRRD
jgi:protein-tyrosine phosphatase